MNHRPSCVRREPSALGYSLALFLPGCDSFDYVTKRCESHPRALLLKPTVARVKVDTTRIERLQAHFKAQKQRLDPLGAIVSGNTLDTAGGRR